MYTTSDQLVAGIRRFLLLELCFIAIDTIHKFTLQTRGCLTEHNEIIAMQRGDGVLKPDPAAKQFTSFGG